MSAKASVASLPASCSRDEVTARMLVHPLRDVVDLVVDDQPQVARAGVLPDLVPGVSTIHERMPPSWFQHLDAAVRGVVRTSRGG